MITTFGYYNQEDFDHLCWITFLESVPFREGDIYSNIPNKTLKDYASMLTDKHINLPTANMKIIEKFEEEADTEKITDQDDIDRLREK